MSKRVKESRGLKQNIVRRLLHYVRPYGGYVAGVLITSLLYVGFVLLGPVLYGEAIDAMLGPGEVDFETVYFMVGGFALCVLFAFISQKVQGDLVNVLCYRLVRDLRRDAFDSLTAARVRYVDTHAQGDIIARIVNDVDIVSDGLLQGVSQLFTGVMTIFATLVVMFVVNYIIALVVVVLTPLSLFVAAAITKKTFRLFQKQMRIQGELTAHTKEMFGGQKTVILFNEEEYSEKKFEAINARLNEIGWRAQYASALTNPSTRFVMNTAYAAVGGAGALLALAGQITIGSISSFLMYSNLFSKPFTEISGVMTQLQSAVSSAQRVFDLLDEPQEDADGEQVLQVREGRVDFLHVRFGYEPGQPLMKDITLHVPAGSRVAIVGRTGAGKTTLVNLLMRFYEIEGGQILIDDQDIRRCTRDSLRRQFGMVLQDTCLFEGTIAENIAFGKPEASRREIEEAARRSGAHEFIRRLDKGYESLIRADSDMLSQGQRQLLAITRVLLMDPRMLILDEATSSIDTLSERHVNQAMELLMKGRTSFIIAHRLSTITDADLILVMEQGDIVEQGTHEALLQADGAYAELFNSQFT